MIARIWHGWTLPENADQYEQLLRAHILPGIHRVSGYEGAQLLRGKRDNRVEFVTITYFRSMEDVKAFAGEDYRKAVIAPEAKHLLLEYDEYSAHYELLDKTS